MTRFLLDTHILLWTASGGLPPKAENIVLDNRNALFFSPASIWEIGIKTNLGREDFKVDPDILYRELIDHGFVELSITSMHALMARTLPPIHKDPFDRMLVAQAKVAGIHLLTSDSALAKYPAPILFVPG